MENKIMRYFILETEIISKSDSNKTWWEGGEINS